MLLSKLALRKLKTEVLTRQDISLSSHYILFISRSKLFSNNVLTFTTFDDQTFHSLRVLFCMKLRFSNKQTQKMFFFQPLRFLNLNKHPFICQCQSFENFSRGICRITAIFTWKIYFTLTKPSPCSSETARAP